MIKGLMKCWLCRKEMVWGNDFDTEGEEGIESHFSCKCGATAIFYHPKGE